jgi:hypothetical protein
MNPSEEKKKQNRAQEQHQLDAELKKIEQEVEKTCVCCSRGRVVP